MIISRTILPKIIHWIDKKKILIIKGSRQVGKTTLLNLLKKRLEKEKKQTLYFSIDHEFDNPIFENSKHFLAFIHQQFLNLRKGRKLYLFLDEFQYLKDSGVFLKTLFDLGKEFIQIIVSGSSSLEIAKSSEFLTGRKIEFQLYPLSYQEFLHYKTGLNLPKDLSLENFKQLKEFYDIYKQKITDPLLEYCSFGGHPEIVTTHPYPDKLVLLKNLVKTYVEKDIVAFLRIENISGFNKLLRILCSQTGNLVNHSELSNTINLNLETLNKYMDILEGTYIFEFVRPFFTNLRKQLSKMPKVYINDFGIKNIVLNNNLPLSLLTGAERENFVYNALKERYEKDQIKFYRTVSKAEIDFILDLPGNPIPIEVKSISKKIAIPKIMQSFGEKYGVIVTENVLIQSEKTFFIPLALLPFIEF